MASSIKQKVFSGTIWMAGVSVLQQILQFVVQIVLARLLVPNDYGTAALVMTIGSFAVVLATAGIGAAIVQRKDLPDGVVDAAAVITFGMSLVLAGLLFLSSPLLASTLKVPALTILLKIVSIDILLKVLISFYDSLMLRRMMYRTLAIRSIAGLFVQSAVAIVLAFLSLGPMALVVGYVSGSFTQLVLCVHATRYVPHSLGDIHAVKGVFKFGAWVLLGKIANQLATTLDQMIVTRVLNVATLGLYNIARQLTGIVPNMFLHIVGRVTLPIFSRHQDDLNWIEANYWRGNRLNLMIVLPICVIFACFSHGILTFLYGSKWLAAVPVMRICTVIVAIFSIDAGYSSTVYQAVGKPQYGMIVLLFSLPFLPTCVYVGGSTWGVTGFTWSVAVYALVCYLLTLCLMRYFFKFSVAAIIPILFRSFLSVLPTAFLGVVLTVFFFEGAPPPPLFSRTWFWLGIKLASCSFLCLSVYTLTIRFTMKDDFFFLLNGLRGSR